MLDLVDGTRTTRPYNRMCRADEVAQSVWIAELEDTILSVADVQKDYFHPVTIELYDDVFSPLSFGELLDLESNAWAILQDLACIEKPTGPIFRANLSFRIFACAYRLHRERNDLRYVSHESQMILARGASLRMAEKVIFATVVAEGFKLDQELSRSLAGSYAELELSSSQRGDMASSPRRLMSSSKEFFETNMQWI